jgi:hypothetical protein
MLVQSNRNLPGTRDGNRCVPGACDQNWFSASYACDDDEFIESPSFVGNDTMTEFHRLSVVNSKKNKAPTGRGAICCLETWSRDVAPDELPLMVLLLLMGAARRWTRQASASRESQWFLLMTWLFLSSSKVNKQTANSIMGMMLYVHRSARPACSDRGSSGLGHRSSVIGHRSWWSFWHDDVTRKFLTRVTIYRCWWWRDGATTTVRWSTLSGAYCANIGNHYGLLIKQQQQQHIPTAWIVNRSLSLLSATNSPIKVLEKAIQ